MPRSAGVCPSAGRAPTPRQKTGASTTDPSRAQLAAESPAHLADLDLRTARPGLEPGTPFGYGAVELRSTEPKVRGSNPLGRVARLGRSCAFARASPPARTTWVRCSEVGERFWSIFWRLFWRHPRLVATSFPKRWRWRQPVEAAAVVLAARPIAPCRPRGRVLTPR
jgi:hypothetical protein